MLLAGLDIETTGLYLEQGHRLIQVGAYILDTITRKTNTYVMDVQPTGNMAIDAKALEVNKFDLHRISKAMPTATADKWLYAMLLQDGYQPDTLIPVGWNVINFDMQFIKQELPKFAEFFTYANDSHSTRAIDLTGMGLLLEYKLGHSYKQIKTMIAEHCEKALGYNQAHDAGYDAQCAILALDWFRDLLKEGV